MSLPRHHRSLSVPAAIDRGVPWQVPEHNMADNQDRIQQDTPPTFPYPLSSGRRNLPRRNTETSYWEPKFGPGNPNKAHRRFSSVLKSSDPPQGPNDPTTLGSNIREEINGVQPGVNSAAQDGVRLDTAPENGPFDRLDSPSVASTSLATVAPSSRGSNSSGEGGVSTATERPFIDKEASGKATTRRRRFPTKQPNALHFLDSDSPTVTAESIRRSMEEASRRSPTSIQVQSPSTHSASSVSSIFRDDASDANGEHETDRSTSPERGVEGPDEGHLPANVGPRIPSGQNRKRSYGFPDIPRDNSEHSHIPPSDHTSREPNRGRSRHIPKAERLPLTGYELLASKLSTSSSNHAGPHLRPIYRRFETLNHRLLLYLQDELCELEDQLHRLDAADTQNRRLPNCIFPASRRAEFMAGGELHWHKSEAINKIGFKLEQYNRILSSSRETQGMPTPTLEDIQEYRHYLVTHAPIAEVETHFLDATDDLVCVNDEDQVIVDEDPINTPIPPPDFTMAEPRGRSPIKSRPVSPFRQEESIAETAESTYDDVPIIPLSVAVTVAVILPILTFLIIPGYLGRLTVVILVGLSILGALIQGGIVAVRTWELLICVSLYGAVMAVIAGIV